MSTVYVPECFGIIPKNQGEVLLSGFGLEQRLQQQSTPACFAGHECSMVVHWNVCFLSVQSSLFVSAWLWTTSLQYNYSTDCLMRGISRRNMHIPFWFLFHPNRHGNKETNRKSVDVKCNNSQCMQKMIKKWKEPSFLKKLLVAFMNFWLSILKDLLALTW